jgi:hypothetical protein
MLPGLKAILKNSVQWLVKRNIDLLAGFQCFIAGGIVAISCLISLFYLYYNNSNDIFGLQDDLLGLVLLLTLIGGLSMMVAGYLIILLIRLGRFLTED